MSPVLLVVIPIVVIILAMIFGYYVPGARRRRLKNSPIAIAPFGRERSAPLPPRPSRETPPSQPAVPRPHQASPAPAASFAPPLVTPIPEPITVERETVGMESVPVEARAARAQEAEDVRRILRLQVAGDPRSASREQGSPAGQGSANLRLEKPIDGTLQFLPGKLEVVEGRDVGQEIRFVRTPGPEGQTITFGRQEGAQYRHVQLQEKTVSRQHAKMVLEGKTWSLHNLSKTNPVSVNGLALVDEGASVVLRDGDRIEMGEVVFRFRSR